MSGFSLLNAIRTTVIITTVVICYLSIARPVFALDVPTDEITITASDDSEFSFYHYPAKGSAKEPYVIIWIASNYGLNVRSIEMAQHFAENGVEVWQIDLADAVFQPRGVKQMRAFTGEYVADIIEAAHKKTGKNVVLLTRSYGAIPVLRGARAWQSRKPSSDYLAGAILFSPDLYSSIPALGQDPEYMPITSAVNIPIWLYQNGRRGNRWHVDKVIQQLESGGSHVFLKILPGVTGLLSDQDYAPETVATLKKLPKELPNTIHLLDTIATPLEPSSATQRKSVKNQPAKSDNKKTTALLKPFRGKLTPLKIDLEDINGKRYKYEDYRDKVTVINFWASWCPPCVEEIPSLNRLHEAMRGTDFELIMINYAEEPDRVRKFLKRFNVKSPALLDPTGQYSVKWNVVVYPSTFVIGPDGEIHYGVNAAIPWDSPQVIDELRQLLKKKG